MVALSCFSEEERAFFVAMGPSLDVIRKPSCPRS